MPASFPVFASRTDNPATYFVTSDFRDTSQHVVRLGDRDSFPIRLRTPGVSYPINQQTRAIVRPKLAARPTSGVAIGDGQDYRIRVLREMAQLNVK